MMAAMMVQAICLLCSTAMAETIWTPSVQLTGVRDDNIQFSRTDPVDDYIYLAKPQLELNYNQELTQIAADGNIIIRRYQDNDEFNDEIYKFDFKGNTKLSERFRLRGDYEFIKDTTLDSELREVGRIYLREDRFSHDVRLVPSFDLTERTRIGLAGRYRDVAYDSDAFVDYSVWDISLPVSRRLETQIDTIYVSPGYTNRDSDTARSKSYNLRLGWKHETTERLDLDLSVGARHTEHEQVATGETNDSWNGLGALRLNYDFETGSLMIDFQHDLRNTADGNQANVSRLITRLRWYFTERIGLDLNGRYYNTRTEGENNNDTREYIQAGSDLFYNLTENHAVFIAYEYSQDYQENIEDEPRAERNRIWAGIRLSFPMN